MQDALGTDYVSSSESVNIFALSFFVVKFNRDLAVDYKYDAIARVLMTDYFNISLVIVFF